MKIGMKGGNFLKFFLIFLLVVVVCIITYKIYKGYVENLPSPPEKLVLKTIEDINSKFKSHNGVIVMIFWIQRSRSTY